MDNHADTQPLSFLQAGCPSCHPTNSVKALKVYVPPSLYARGAHKLLWGSLGDFWLLLPQTKMDLDETWNISEGPWCAQKKSKYLFYVLYETKISMATHY